jgi:hypothetical protein
MGISWVKPITGGIAGLSVGRCARLLRVGRRDSFASCEDVGGRDLLRESELGRKDEQEGAEMHVVD